MGIYIALFIIARYFILAMVLRWLVGYYLRKFPCFSLDLIYTLFYLLFVIFILTPILYIEYHKVISAIPEFQYFILFCVFIAFIYNISFTDVRFLKVKAKRYKFEKIVLRNIKDRIQMIFKDNCYTADELCQVLDVDRKTLFSYDRELIQYTSFFKEVDAELYPKEVAYLLLICDYLIKQYQLSWEKVKARMYGFIKYIPMLLMRCSIGSSKKIQKRFKKDGFFNNILLLIDYFKMSRKMKGEKKSIQTSWQDKTTTEPLTLDEKAKKVKTLQDEVKKAERFVTDIHKKYGNVKF